jgi:hypothetical protein
MRRRHALLLFLWITGCQSPSPEEDGRAGWRLTTRERAGIAASNAVDEHRRGELGAMSEYADAVRARALRIEAARQANIEARP